MYSVLECGGEGSFGASVVVYPWHPPFTLILNSNHLIITIFRVDDNDAIVVFYVDDVFLYIVYSTTIL